MPVRTVYFFSVFLNFFHVLTSLVIVLRQLLSSNKNLLKAEANFAIFIRATVKMRNKLITKATKK